MLHLEVTILTHLLKPVNIKSKLKRNWVKWAEQVESPGYVIFYTKSSLIILFKNSVYFWNNWCYSIIFTTLLAYKILNIWTKSVSGRPDVYVINFHRLLLFHAQRWWLLLITCVVMVYDLQFSFLMNAAGRTM